MAPVSSDGQDLTRLFRAITEQTFHVEFGIADPRLIDYLSSLLVRFIRIDAIYPIRDLLGRRLEEVADMLLHAEQTVSNVRREIHRHIGDFTLFWTGVYPEALRTLRHPERKDALIDYRDQGKRSYSIAAELSQPSSETSADILRRLSDEYDVVSLGLNHVRKEWSRLAEQNRRGWSADWN